jgi:hypothetical protein
MWCCSISPKDNQLPQFPGDLLPNLWAAIVLVLAQLQKENIQISCDTNCSGRPCSQENASR